MHINSISCGQGAPSLYTIVMAGTGLFPADVVIVADTGWETDCLWSNGNRSDAREFFNEVTEPLCREFGIEAKLVRANNGVGVPLLPIPDTQRLSEKVEIDIPLYGSMGGRLKQSCTSKWKVSAVRQELRRMGAETATTALGLHSGESHRLKRNDVQWQLRRWPLLDVEETHSGGLQDMGIGRRFSREFCTNQLKKMNIPYLVTSLEARSKTGFFG